MRKPGLFMVIVISLLVGVMAGLSMAAGLLLYYAGRTPSTSAATPDKSVREPGAPKSFKKAPEEAAIFDFREDFTGGAPQLVWVPFPGFSTDQVAAVKRNDSPDKDGWAGQVTNKSLGGFASLSYSGDQNLMDYSVESWVYVDVTPGKHGTLHGVAVRVNPDGSQFYRLAAQFGKESRITLAYVGADLSLFPDYIHEWRGDWIPGGPPTKSGWHRMRLKISGDKLTAYWDGYELPDGPFTDDRIASGFFGVYTNFTGGEEVVNTYFDGLVVKVQKAVAQ